MLTNQRRSSGLFYSMKPSELLQKPAKRKVTADSPLVAAGLQINGLGKLGFWLVFVFDHRVTY